MSARLALRKWFAGLTFLCAGLPAVSAEVYDIDPRHTFSAFEYDHWGLSRQQGRFDTTRGAIELDPETGTGKIAIEIDAASVSTGIDSFNQLLRSSQFFDAENHPRIVFKSSSMRFEEDRLMEVDGDLTVKDISRPITMKIKHYRCRFMPIYGTRACGANATATLLRSEFELGRYTPFVSDQINLYISVEAIRRNPPVEEQNYFP